MKALRAQSVSEYTICVVGIILVAIIMQSYVRRALQGRYRDLVGQTTTQVAGSGESQYEPYYRNENFTMSQTVNTTENFIGGGAKNSTFLEDKTTRNGTSVEEINPYGDTLYAQNITPANNTPASNGEWWLLSLWEAILNLFKGGS